jgi:peroxidase
LNQATNKFDLSQLYGNDVEEQKRLRNLNQGLLRTSIDDSSLLPQAHDTTCIRQPNDTLPCYTSGDTRVNVNPIVTALYTIFLRSHNQIAQKLKRINPKWSDAQLFKVTRSINIAIYQKIIYNDWANVVLGKRMATEIRSKSHEFDGRRYKSKKISNEFGAAAIKFYNSMMPGDVKSHHDDVIASSKSMNLENVIEAVGVSHQQNRDILKLQEVFYKPRDLSKMQFLDRLMSAVLRQNAMAMDSSYVDDLSINMYRANMHGNRKFGGDSLAYDIQRGRDHGLSSYLSYIKKCLNVKINSWDDLKSIVREDDLNRLRTIYASMHDVDLIVGGLAEISSENATVGPTFSCIISECKL